MARVIPKKLRFEILKRDEFKCRYCGRSEGEGVTLHVDHVIPVALGGRNDPENLVVACADCNLGKAANMLNDPQLIGVDFKARKKVFDTARESLDAYRDYMEAKDRWEYSLVSELIAPLEPLFRQVAWWEVHEGQNMWHFNFDAGCRLDDFPPKLRDDYIQEFVTEENAKAEARVKRSVLYFFHILGPDAVRSAAQIAGNKGVLDDAFGPDEAFRYFCGICQRKAKEATR